MRLVSSLTPLIVLYSYERMDENVPTATANENLRNATKYGPFFVKRICNTEYEYALRVP
jgi:hypothetical protein